MVIDSIFGLSDCRSPRSNFLGYEAESYFLIVRLRGTLLQRRKQVQAGNVTEISWEVQYHRVILCLQAGRLTSPLSCAMMPAPIHPSEEVQT